MQELPIQTKQAIIANEISLYQGSMYQAELRYKVNKKIGTSAEALKSIEDEMVKYQQAIDLLEEDLKVLNDKSPNH